MISEDGEAGQASAGAEDDLLDEKAGDDVLELTDVVDDEPDAVEEEAPVDVFGDFQIETDQDSGNDTMPPMADDDNALVSQATASTANAAFSRRSEEHTSELQSLMRISYAVFCLKKNTTTP